MAKKLSNLANKSKVKFGSLYGSPIVWIVADKNHAGYPSNSVTLVTNQIIKMLCFDATEPSNGNSDRRNYGNNRYIYSNLRQWLNSPAAAGQWYTAQHSADQTPDSSHVWNGVNPYSGLAGFLNAFTANERAALLNTTITVGKSSTDGGGTETCTDKIFPLSCTEVGLSGDHVCGSKLAIFSDNNSRIATVTASCVANSNYSGNPGSGAAWYYWLRDAYAGSAYNARFVISDGATSCNFGKKFDVGTSMTDNSKREGLALKVSELQAEPATWRVVPMSTSALKRGEIAMSIAPDSAMYNASAIDLAKCSAPLDITENGWFLAAPTEVTKTGAAADAVTHDAAKALPLIVNAKIAGSNVNDAGCTPVVRVTYSIIPMFETGDTQTATAGGVGSNR
jgi:hypothetical protein